MPGGWDNGRVLHLQNFSHLNFSPQRLHRWSQQLEMRQQSIEVFPLVDTTREGCHPDAEQRIGFGTNDSFKDLAPTEICRTAERLCLPCHPGGETHLEGPWLTTTYQGSPIIAGS